MCGKLSDVIGTLAANINTLSHELKTPVTALNASLENMILGIGKYKNRDVCLVECKEITERLASMIKEVLDTSGLNFTQEKQIRFHLEIQEECPVHLSKRSLEKLLSNVLSNAVSYTMPEHRISVVLSACRITIENECIPIKAEDVPRLFEPFYHPDFARDRKFGGNGLGLYIVDTLADALGLSSNTYFGLLTPKKKTILQDSGFYKGLNLQDRLLSSDAEKISTNITLQLGTFS